MTDLDRVYAWLKKTGLDFGLDRTAAGFWVSGAYLGDADFVEAQGRTAVEAVHRLRVEMTAMGN